MPIKSCPGGRYSLCNNVLRYSVASPPPPPYLFETQGLGLRLGARAKARG